MDATNQKNLARALVALMVGSTFVAAIAPTAEATHLGTGGTDVTIDVRQTPQNVVIENGTDMVFPGVWVPTTPSGFKIRHSTPYELTFAWLNPGSPGTGYGYIGATGDASLEIVNATGVVAVAGTPVTGQTGAFRNATFLITSAGLPGPGLYHVRVVGGATIGSFVVYPHDDISVSVTTNVNPLVWTGNQAVINVATGVAGAWLSSDAPGLFAAPVATDANGNYAFISTLPMGAGTWTIYASRDLNNGPQCASTSTGQIVAGTTSPCPSGQFSLPERMGNATLVVQQNTLTVTPVSTSAFTGFNNEIAYTFHYPTTNNNVFGSTTDGTTLIRPTDATVSHWNLSIVTPTNFMFHRNVSGQLPVTASALTGFACRNLNLAPTEPTVTTCGDATAPTVTLSIVNNVPRITIQNATWQSGTYQFRLQLETDPTAGFDSEPEYVASWTLSPATPQAVTLSGPASIDVPYANSAAGTGGAGLALTSPTTAAIGTTTITVTVSGTTLNEHPLCRIRGAPHATTNPEGLVGACNPTATGWTASSTPPLSTVEGRIETDNVPTGCSLTTAGANNCFVDNITLGGDVLPGWRVTGYNPATGQATIVLTPARNGTVMVNVSWKGTTTTLEIPVVNGARLTTSVTNMTVDEAATITVNVKNAFGGNVENANVWLFQRIVSPTTGAASSGAFQGTGATVIVGTGAAGAGAGGDYTFSVRPNQVQDLVFYTEVGGGTARVNASYAAVTVLPSSTLSATLTQNQTMAALRTPLAINVTNATQGWTGTQANFRVYFLNPVQVRDLMTNGTTALFTGTNVPTAVTIDNANAERAFFNVTLTEENDYSVWFCASTTAAITDCRTATHDNRQSMPVFNVTRYKATFSPTQVASSPDIQANAVVQVTITDRDGNPANGTLRIVQGPANANSNIVASVSPGGANTTGGTAVTNGMVNLTLTGVGAVGALSFEFDPTEPTGTQANVFALTEGNLSVVAGNLTFNPARAPILQSTLVTIRLANFTGAGLPGRVIRLCSVSLNSNFPTTFPAVLSTGTGSDTERCPAVGVTGEDGSTGIVVTPTSLSPIGVYINGSYTQRTIPVTAGVLVLTVNPTSPQQGGNVTFTVTQPGGVPSVGARILVVRDGATVLDATADGNGQATLSNLAAGNYTVTAIRTGYDNGTASFSIGSQPTQNQTGARFELRNLVVPQTVSVGTPVTVRVTVSNVGNESGSANAQLLVNNIQRGSQAITLDAGANQTLEFEFNATVAGTYSVVVRIGDVTIGPQDITVGTQTTTPTTTPTSGVTPTTSPTSVVTPTTSPTTGVTPTATPTSTPASTTPEPTVPGFELVALLAALGVALLVLRRRN